MFILRTRSIPRDPILLLYTARNLIFSIITNCKSLIKLQVLPAVSPIKQQLGVVTYFSQKKNIDIYGVTEDYKDTSNIVMENGSFIRDQDAFSAVIGSKVAR